jgi:hypothetical protein
VLSLVVEGLVVLRDRLLLTLDEPAIEEEALAYCHRIVERLGLDHGASEAG